MSLIPTIYSSTDPGAPQLSGTAGSLINVLRAVLVNGYGTAPNDKPGLGWTEEFTGTNRAVFRPNPATSSGAFLRVDDTGTVGNARHACLRAYGTMSDVDTGIEPAPTVAKAGNGCLWVKSNMLDASARSWWAIGNERCFYLFIRASTVLDDDHQSPYFAGDLDSLRPGDASAFAVSATVASYTGGVNLLTHLFNPTTGPSSVPLASAVSLYLLRGYAQTVGAVEAWCVQGITGHAWGFGGFQFPYPVNNGLLTARGFVYEGSLLCRAALPGLYVPLHPVPFGNLTLLQGVDGFPPGVELLAKRFSQYLGATSTAFKGQVLFDVTREW